MTEQISEAKQKALGPYVTSAEANEKMQAAPDKDKLLDVRTPEEFIFVGHPEMASCIPLGIQSYQWDEEKGYYDLGVNSHFVAQVRESPDRDESVMLGCQADRGVNERSSSRPWRTMPQLDSGTSFQAPTRSLSGSETTRRVSADSVCNTGWFGYWARRVSGTDYVAVCIDFV